MPKRKSESTTALRCDTEFSESPKHKNDPKMNTKGSKPVRRSERSSIHVAVAPVKIKEESEEAYPASTHLSGKSRAVKKAKERIIKKHDEAFVSKSTFVHDSESTKAKKKNQLKSSSVIDVNAAESHIKSKELNVKMELFDFNVTDVQNSVTIKQLIDNDMSQSINMAADLPNKSKIESSNDTDGSPTKMPKLSKSESSLVEQKVKRNLSKKLKEQKLNVVRASTKNYSKNGKLKNEFELPSTKAKKKDNSRNETLQTLPTQRRRLLSRKLLRSDAKNLKAVNCDRPGEIVTKEDTGNSVNTVIESENTKFVGAHFSIAGGLHKCIEEAVRIGAKACGLFLKSQRQWASKPLTEETIIKFKETLQNYNYPIDKLLPHGSYLINCGSPNPEMLEKSRNSLIDELQRCELLGIQLYNFHPGSSCGEISVEKCLDNIGDSINIAHSKTKTVITVVENMCCQGNTVGGKLEELKGIIDRVADKSRIGVCIDTCHAFAAGYDLSSETGFKAFIREFEMIIGFKYLKALHLNDSKGKLGCHLDRHENIGNGNLGINCFKYVMKEANFNNIPIILETPLDLSDEEEIKILYSL